MAGLGTNLTHYGGVLRNVVEPCFCSRLDNLQDC